MTLGQVPTLLEDRSTEHGVVDGCHTGSSCRSSAASSSSVPSRSSPSESSITTPTGSRSRAGGFTSESVGVALAPYLTDDLVRDGPAAVDAIWKAGDSLIETSPDPCEGLVGGWRRPVVGRAGPDRQDVALERKTASCSRRRAPPSTSAPSTVGESSGSHDTDHLVRSTPARRRPGTRFSRALRAYDIIPQRPQPCGGVRPVMTAAWSCTRCSLLLVLFLGRRLNRAERRHTDLLERMIEMSDAERRRVAAQVHDGVVQDLIGISFGLAALAESTPEQPSRSREWPQGLEPQSLRCAVSSAASTRSRCRPVDGSSPQITRMGRSGTITNLRGDHHVLQKRPQGRDTCRFRWQLVLIFGALVASAAGTRTASRSPASRRARRFAELTSP